MWQKETNTKANYQSNLILIHERTSNVTGQLRVKRIGPKCLSFPIDILFTDKNA